RGGRGGCVSPSPGAAFGLIRMRRRSPAGRGAMATSTAPSTLGWRTPAVIVACGCLMAILTFGPRSTFGFFLQPLSTELGTGRDVFALAVAIQNLLWGLGQP